MLTLERFTFLFNPNLIRYNAVNPGTDEPGDLLDVVDPPGDDGVVSPGLRHDAVAGGKHSESGEYIKEEKSTHAKLSFFPSSLFMISWSNAISQLNIIIIVIILNNIKY